MAFAAQSFWPMLNASGNNDEFAGIHIDIAAAQSHAHPASYNEKQLILLIVVMPVKLPLKFCEFDLRVIDITRDFRGPMIRKSCERVFEIDFYGCVGRGHSPGAFALIAIA